MTAKQLVHLLNSNGNRELGDLVKRARDMGELTEILSGSLPADLAGSVVAANIRDESELVLICHSSAWAARLRFEEAALIKLAQQHGVNVDKVSVKVARVDYNKRG
jgi:hypothetical protein